MLGNYDGEDSEKTSGYEVNSKRLQRTPDKEQGQKDFFFPMGHHELRMTKKLIMNLSLRQLTSKEIDILNFGLSFVPKPHPNV